MKTLVESSRAAAKRVLDLLGLPFPQGIALPPFGVSKASYPTVGGMGSMLPEGKKRGEPASLRASFVASEPECRQMRNAAPRCNDENPTPG
jgi:hypothetical protein